MGARMTPRHEFRRDLSGPAPRPQDVTFELAVQRIEELEADKERLLRERESLVREQEAYKRLLETLRATIDTTISLLSEPEAMK